MSKNIKQIVCAFTGIIVAGIFLTALTQNILDEKRKQLYENRNTGTENSSETATGTSISSHTGGPGANIITKEKYMENIRLIEKQIVDVWSNVSENGGISEISAAKYEKGLWDEELYNIIQLYYKKANYTVTEDIKQSQESFVAERERQAQNAAKEAGEALDGLAYIKEYNRLTKEKVYTYIDSYFKEDK